MTRYVKTLEDVRRLQKLYAEPEFEQHRGISGVYETDPEIIAAVLPPPLKPTPRRTPKRTLTPPSPDLTHLHHH